MKGNIFDIQEFAVNDGPGLRVTVFMKGCPLHCKWCHNPEGQSSSPQKNLLTGEIVGREWSVDELMSRILSLKDAFDISNGGVTFSGGEATAQPEFLIAAASALRAKGIHVNLDTCGYCPTETFVRILDNVDLVYYDIKCMDPELHFDMTGVDNKLILTNARKLSESTVPYRIRVPLTLGVGNTPDNISATEAFVSSLPRPPMGIDYLPFNDLAGAKYAAYGMNYQFGGSAL